MIEEEQAAALLAGGIMQHGYQCGMIWGSALAAGAEAYRLYGLGPEAESKAILAAQKVVESFQGCTGEINCLEITDIDKSSSILKMIFVFLIKGKTLGCFKLAGKYSPIALKTINDVFSEQQDKAPSPPVSCTALLAQKMSASELHTTMVAGLAGGIGLCGGGCGALGAAIWLNRLKDSDSKMDFKDPKTLELIETFLKSSDYEFECSDIVGRKFESVDDHSKYIALGGCKEIIEALATC